MAGRGPQSFKKRQKEQQRKEWQEEKRAKRLEQKPDTDNPKGSGPPIEALDESEIAANLDRPLASI